MEIRQLKYASAVARLKNTALAAEEYYTSRQAVSKSIQHLEQELGVTLFSRSKHMELTDAGRAIIPKVDEVLKNINELEFYARSLSSSYEGLHVTIALTAFPLDYLYFNSRHRTMHALSEFKDKSSRTDMNILHLPDAAILDAIKNGTIDIGIIQGSITEDGFKCIDLSQIEMRVIATVESGLCDLEYVGIEDLKGVPIRTPLDFNSFYIDLIRRCREHGFNPLFQDVPLNDEAIYTFAKAGGVHIQPYDPCMKDAYPENAYLPFHPNDRMNLPLSLVYQEGTVSPTALKLARYLARSAK